MPTVKKILRFFAVFAAATAWFALLIPWHGWNDPDAFYHATMARLIWQGGPLKSFPWLDLTLLGKYFADLHLGYHLFIAPFTALFGDLGGLRIATVVLTGLCVATFDACLAWLKIRRPLIWSILLGTSYSFVFRSLLGKATPLSLTLFLLGLAAAWKRRPWLIAVIAGLYALSYAGWIYLAGSIMLLAFGDVLYDHIIHGMGWKKTLIRSRWRECVAAWAGALIGLCLHPNFPNVFRLFWAQVVTIGLGTPYAHVILGNEWLPADPLGMFSNYAPFVILALVGLSGLLFARREPLDEDRARLLVSVGWIMAVLTALTLKSRRNTEYLAPVVALWCAILWSLVDARRLRDSFISACRSFPKWVQRALPIFIAAVFVFAVSKQVYELWNDMHPGGYTDTVYQQSMDAISQRAQPGDRVFHTSWDEFPMLFHADQRLKYISGLDPTFLYIVSPTLSDQVRDVTWDLSTSTSAETWSLIHDELHSRFVFVSRTNHDVFLKRVQADPRYLQIASSTDSAAFEVVGAHGNATGTR